MFINHSSKQVTAKIVYYGPGLSGKTSNLQYIFSVTNPRTRGELVSIETEIDRTLFFDLLPINVGLVDGYQTKFQLYTVPGQIFYDATRKLVLKGADGIVFVVDSQELREQASLESFENLKSNLASYNVNIKQIPLVFQFNKQDLANVSSTTRLKKLFNITDAPCIEAIAIDGTGVIETLREISSLTLKKVRALISQSKEEVEPTNDLINFDTNNKQEIIKREELPFKKISLESMDNLDNIFIPGRESGEDQDFEEIPLINFESKTEYDTLIEEESPFKDLVEQVEQETVEPGSIMNLERDEMKKVEETLSPNVETGQEYGEEILDEELTESGEVVTLEQEEVVELAEPLPEVDEKKAQDTLREEDLPFKTFPEDDLDVNIDESEQYVELEEGEMIDAEERTAAESDTLEEPAIGNDDKEQPFTIPDVDIEEMLDVKKKVSQLFDGLVDKSRLTVIKELVLKNPDLSVEIKDRDGNLLESLNMDVDPSVKKITIILDIKK